MKGWTLEVRRSNSLISSILPSSTECKNFTVSFASKLPRISVAFHFSSAPYLRLFVLSSEFCAIGTDGTEPALLSRAS
jgi:hypothetical protein